MTKTLNKTILMTAALLFLLGLAAATVSANHAWSKYHWDIATTDAPLQIGNNLSTPEWNASLGIASTDWNQSVLKNTIIDGAGNPDCGYVLDQVEVCNGEYGTTGWIGIAEIAIYRGPGHIAYGMVKLNDTYYNTPYYDTVAWRNMVMCQEVGHTFGLGHQDETFDNTNLGSCMDYTNDPDGTISGQLDNQHPNQHDYDMMTEIYAHLNSTDGGGGTKPPKEDNPNKGGKNRSQGLGVNANLPDSAEWGMVVKTDAEGNPSLFARDTEDGMTVYTHVTWTEDHSDHGHTH